MATAGGSAFRRVCDEKGSTQAFKAAGRLLPHRNPMASFLGAPVKLIRKIDFPLDKAYPCAA